MHIKTIVTALGSALILSACVTSVDKIHTSAIPTVIDMAKTQLKDMKEFEVSDNGVITFKPTLPGDSRWATVKTKEWGYRVACQNLRWYIDRGMVVRALFRGNSGMLNDYDEKRCETEVPTKLFERSK